ETGPFLANLPIRVPILLLGQWSPIPADVGAMLRPPISTTFWWLTIAILAVLFAAMAPLLRRDSLACFSGVGMFLAAIPVSATIAGNRLLTFVSVGAAGLLARFFGFVFGGAGSSMDSRWSIPMKVVAWFLVVVHAVIAPISLPLRAGNPLGP